MKDVTLVAIDFITHNLTKFAVEHSLKSFEPKEILVISDQDFVSGSTYQQHSPVSGMSEYANVMLKGVSVNTSHALYVQWDGMVNTATMWSDEFLEYDYIGAPWPWMPEGKNVGNGGFSLRSRKLLEICATDANINLTTDEPVAEDNIIGIRNRQYLESTHGIKFAPTSVAEKFSFELGVPRPSFGFHGLWNMVSQLSDADLAYILPLINYADWNIYKWVHTLTAAVHRGDQDILNLLLQKLVEHKPEVLPQISNHLEQVGQNETLTFL